MGGSWESPETPLMGTSWYSIFMGVSDPIGPMVGRGISTRCTTIFWGIRTGGRVTVAGRETTLALIGNRRLGGKVGNLKGGKVGRAGNVGNLKGGNVGSLNGGW